MHGTNAKIIIKFILNTVRGGGGWTTEVGLRLHLTFDIAYFMNVFHAWLYIFQSHFYVTCIASCNNNRLSILPTHYIYR